MSVTQVFLQQAHLQPGLLYMRSVPICHRQKYAIILKMQGYHRRKEWSILQI